MARGGLLGTARAALSELHARTGTALRRATNRAQGRRFDRVYGVQTEGIIPLNELDIAPERWQDSIHYQPIPPKQLREALARLRVDYSRTVFVDLGAGKGRALLLASLLPFKKVVGVELSRRLTEAARENAASFASNALNRAPIELIEGDAAEFALPGDPLVVYLYNPFGLPVMNQVIANLAESYREAPRPIVVLYFYPVLAAAWDRVEFLTCTERSTQMNRYQTNSAKTALLPPALSTALLMLGSTLLAF